MKKNQKLKKVLIGFLISVLYLLMAGFLITQSFGLLVFVQSFWIHFLVVIIAIVGAGFLLARFNKVLAIILSLIIFGWFFFWFNLILKEEWCHQPTEWPWQMVRYDVAYSPDEVKKWQESGGWGGYTAIGVSYSSACEKEFNFFEIVFYSVFPKTKQEWDENKRQELTQLVTASHKQEIRVAFDNPELWVTFESIVDNDKENPDDQSYFYWTGDDYLVEINGLDSRIKNIRCDNCQLNKSEVLSDEELEKVYIGFIQRIEPIFTQNHWLESWERYTIDKKGDNTFFRLNSKTEKLNDGSPAHIQIGLDQFGNLLNYAKVQK